MNNSNEGGDNPNEDNGFRVEKMYLSVEEKTMFRTENDFSQMPSSSNEEPPKKTIIVTTGIDMDYLLLKLDLGVPANDREKSCLRVSWYLDDKSGTSNNRRQVLSINSVFNIRYAKLLEGIYAYLKKNPNSLIYVGPSVGTQTSPIPPASTIFPTGSQASASGFQVLPSGAHTSYTPRTPYSNMQYYYRHPTHYDDDSD